MKKIAILCFVIPSFFLLSGCSSYALPPIEENNISLSEIPEYSGDLYVVLNNNVPEFEEEDFTTTSFEAYSNLDSLSRARVAFANIGYDLMPTEERGSIASIKPSGWQTVKYDFVDGKYLYNRCHLIGFQLTGENANEKNLITCTRSMNVSGMLPFENMVADYIKETKNHVLYRVAPIYEGDNLVASGITLEAMSVEDKGESISIYVYIYNVEDQVEIDYLTGNSKEVNASDSEEIESIVETEVRGNTKSKIYHVEGQANYDAMKDSNNLIIFSSEEEAIEAGYTKAKR